MPGTLGRYRGGAEFAPRSRRGQLSIIQQGMITVGILVSYLVALVVLQAALHSAGSLDWPLILGLGAVPALISVALRARMPGSPGGSCSTDATQIPRRHSPSSALGVREEEVRHAADELARVEQARLRKAAWTAGVRRAGRPPPAGPVGYAGMAVFMLVAAAGVGFLTGVPKDRAGDGRLPSSSQ